jgi:signal transduction histidine kinase
VRRIPIRVKLTAALSAPLVALLVVTGIEMAAIARNVDEVRDQTGLARAAVGPAGLITRLHDERSWPALELTGSEDLIEVAVEDYDESRRLTDEAITEFRADLATRGTAAEAAYAPALQRLDEELAQLRADIDGDTDAPLHGERANTAFADEVFTRYTSLIRPFFDATARVASAVQDGDLRRGTELVNLSSRQIEMLSALARLLLVTGTVGGGVDAPDEIDRIVELKVRWDASVAELGRATAPYDAVVARHFPHEFVAGFTDMADRALAGEAVDIDELLAPFEAPEADRLRTFRVAMADELIAAADAIQADARHRETIVVAMSLATLAAAFGFTWLVSRSITGPLRSLTRQAKAMATERLPQGVSQVLLTPLGEDLVVPEVEPVRVNTRDEVAEVARALTTVQDTALDLAVEQAVLRRNIADSFVNLGRRNQNLLRRQLDFITALEHREADPTALGNLFRLDHLATRMRRNAESLLVLAGIEPSRQWASPVRLTDVVRAALGEVEDYQRVGLREIEPATVVGPATADLAHLVAELVENALAFSPAQWAVEVAGHWRRDGGYTLAIIDAGEGMTPEALDQANRRLAGAESFTVAPSTYLGHYVAGNLAARHGISVRLDRGRGGHGTVASIDMPPALLTQDAPSGARGPGGVFEPGRAPLGWQAGRLGPEPALDSAVHAAPTGPGAGKQFWGEAQPAGQEQAEIRRAWDARRAAGG